MSETENDDLTFVGQEVESESAPEEAPESVEESETPEPSSSSEPEEVEKNTEVSDEEFRKEKARERFENKARQRKQEEERKQLEEDLRKQILEEQSQKGTDGDLKEPSRPEDMWDEEAVSKYHDDMRQYYAEKASRDAQSIYEQRQAQMHQEQMIRQQQEAVSDTLKVFDGNAEKLGLTKDETEKDADIVASYGINPEIIFGIAKDEAGPALMRDLAANPQVAQDLLNAQTPYEAAVIVANRRISAIESVKPQTTKAPPPTAPIRGSSAVSDEGPEGVTYT